MILFRMVHTLFCSLPELLFYLYLLLDTANKAGKKNENINY